MLNEKSVKAASGFGEVIRTVVYALVIALAIRTLAYEPFSVPSESMLPTLLVGDYFFVSKYSYGYSRHSLPFSPDFFEGRVMEGMPQRGDIAVFKTPADDQTDFVKRIIGLPGDTIQMREGTLYVNGLEARRERVEDFRDVDRFGNVRLVPQYRETLPSGVSLHGAGYSHDAARRHRDFHGSPGPLFCHGRQSRQFPGQQVQLPWARSARCRRKIWWAGPKFCFFPRIAADHGGRSGGGRS